MTLEVDIAQTDVSFVEFCFGVLQVPLYILWVRPSEWVSEWVGRECTLAMSIQL
jgi:hypothetical protein